MTKLDAPLRAEPEVRAGRRARGEPRGPSRTSWRRALVAVLFVAVVVLMLRPGPASMTRTFPNLGDPVFLAWSLAWSGHAVLSQPLHLFDANIFFPHPLSLAYSESLLVLLPPFALLRALGGSAALAINTLMLGLLLLSLAATYSLTRWLTSRTDAAILAAIAYTFSAFTLSHLGHTQLLLLGQFPLAFLAAFRWLEQRRTRDAVLLGAVNVSVLLGALYFAAIYVVCLAVVIVGWVIATRFHPGTGFWKGLGVAAAVSLLAVPVLVPYARLGQERPLVPELGLKPADLVTVAQGSILYTGLDHRANGRNARVEHAFFPGFATMALAAVGAGALVVGLVRRRRAADAVEHDNVVNARRRFVWLLLCAGAASVLLALGPEVQGVPMPFKAFHAFVPGFSGIRVTARLAVPGLLAGCVLAAIGFTVLTRSLRPVVTLALATALGAFLLLEQAAPLYRTELPTNGATLAVYRVLDHKPPGAVVELPMEHPLRDGGAAWAYVEAPRMVYSSNDWHNRVNGYSGDWPDGYLEDLDALNTIPSRSGYATARRLHARYLVLHTGAAAGFPQWSDARVRSTLAQLPPGATAERHGNSWLVDLGPAKR